MSPSEYQHLISFLSKKFDGVGDRLDSMDGRLVRLEVGQEQLRDDLKGVAEGVGMNGERVDRVHGRLDAMDDTLRDLANVAKRSN